MLRKPRFQLPGVPRHVILRGDYREPCFYAKADYNRYLDDPKHLLQGKRGPVGNHQKQYQFADKLTMHGDFFTAPELPVSRLTRNDPRGTFRSDKKNPAAKAGVKEVG